MQRSCIRCSHTRDMHRLGKCGGILSSHQLPPPIGRPPTDTNCDWPSRQRNSAHALDCRRNHRPLWPYPLTLVARSRLSHTGFAPDARSQSAAALATGRRALPGRPRALGSFAAPRSGRSRPRAYQPAQATCARRRASLPPAAPACSRRLSTIPPLTLGGPRSACRAAPGALRPRSATLCPLQPGDNTEWPTATKPLSPGVRQAGE